MNHLGRHILLLAIFLLAFASAALADATSTIDPDEFCSAEPPVQIRCPKTSASVCLCAMTQKSPVVETFSIGAVPISAASRVIRPKAPCVILPDFEVPSAIQAYVAQVPTPPPRA